MAGVEVERDQSLKLVPALASELPKLVARRRFESLSDGLSRDSILKSVFGCGPPQPKDKGLGELS